MSSIFRKIRFLLESINRRKTSSPEMISICVIHALIHETRNIVCIFLPAIMLKIATESTDISTSIISAIVFSSIIPLLTFLLNLVRKKLENIDMRSFNRRVSHFDEKLHNLGLSTAESNDGFSFEEEALMGIYETQGIICDVFSVLLGRLITLVVTLVIFVNVHALLAIFVLMMMLFAFVLDKKLSRKNVFYDQEISKKQYKSTYISEIMFDISHAIEIRFCNAREFLISKFRHFEKDVRTIENKKIKTEFNYNILKNIITIIQTIGIYLFAIWQFSIDALEVYDFLTFTSAALMLSSAIKQIFESYTILSSMELYYDATNKYMAQPNYGSEDGTKKMPETLKSIVFDDVTFTYPNQDAPAIKNLSFSINANDTVAIVGDNGAGKSTIVKLLLRLYKIDSGQILLNGVDIYEYDWYDYCRFFASAFQDFNTYSLTVAENLTFGNDCSNINTHLDNIGLLKKILSLSNGLDTPYTQEFFQDGILFSGGEEQKLIIARALCKESAVILTLDEPSASMDPLAEKELNNLTYNIRRNKCTLFVSHRFSTTRFCTKILVMDKGQLAEMGTHNELIEKNGLYSEMYNMQIALYDNEIK